MNADSSKFSVIEFADYVLHHCTWRQYLPEQILDLAFGTYQDNCLKSGTREYQEEGVKKVSNEEDLQLKNIKNC